MDVPFYHKTKHGKLLEHEYLNIQFPVVAQILDNRYSWPGVLKTISVLVG